MASSAPPVASGLAGRGPWGRGGGGAPLGGGGGVKGPAARLGAVAVRHGLPGLRAGVPGHAGRDAGLHHRLRAHHRRRGEGVRGPCGGGGAGWLWRGGQGLRGGAVRRCGGGARGLAGGSGRPAAGGSCSACLSQQLEFITPFQLYFNPDLIFRKFQVRPHPGTGAPLAPSQRGVGAAGWALGARLPRVVGECHEIPRGFVPTTPAFPGWRELGRQRGVHSCLVTGAWMEITSSSLSLPYTA